MPFWYTLQHRTFLHWLTCRGLNYVRINLVHLTKSVVKVDKHNDQLDTYALNLYVWFSCENKAAANLLLKPTENPQLPISPE